jgi:hypothetical protein
MAPRLPFVVPKRSLTGDTTERVDTRVLQIVYRVERHDAKPQGGGTTRSLSLLLLVPWMTIHVLIN